jgi:hypothetical protein
VCYRDGVNHRWPINKEVFLLSGTRLTRALKAFLQKLTRGAVVFAQVVAPSEAESKHSDDGSQYFVSVLTPFGVNVFGAVTHAYGVSTAVKIGLESPGGKTIGVMPWGSSSSMGAHEKKAKDFLLGPCLAQFLIF